MIDRGASVIEGRRFAIRLSGATCALALGLLPAEVFAADAACAPPEPHPKMTAEIMRGQGGDTSPEAVAFVNALFVHDDCLHATAWRMRDAKGSIRSTARRVMAQCRASLQAYEALELKAARAQPDVPAALAEVRRDGAAKDAGIAATYVDDYRTCGR